MSAARKPKQKLGRCKPSKGDPSKATPSPPDADQDLPWKAMKAAFMIADCECDRDRINGVGIDEAMRVAIARVCGEGVTRMALDFRARIWEDHVLSLARRISSRRLDDEVPF